MAGRAPGSVFLLTDYGLADEFAGVLRGCVARLAPGAPIIDLTHGVTPYDVRAGALTLVRAVPYLGPGVVVAVVDPGVATERRAVAVSVVPGRDDAPRHFVGPDNGLLPWAVEALGGVARAVAIRTPHLSHASRHAGSGHQPRSRPGATFDGRDVFAPAAARLWRGAPITELGDEVDPDGLVRLSQPRVSASPGALEAEVQWVDRFGNVQLAAGPDDADAAGLGPERDVELDVVVGSGVQHARWVPAFAALAPSALGLIVDANGLVSLVCDRQSAATVLRVKLGDIVTIRVAAPGRGSR